MATQDSDEAFAECDQCFDAFEKLAAMMIEGGFCPSVVAAGAAKLWMEIVVDVYPDPNERRELATKIIENLEVGRH